MSRKGKVLKICGWCGKTFLSSNNGKIAYCCEECKGRKKMMKRGKMKMQDNFWSCLSGFKKRKKIVIRESIKDLENALDEIENETEEIKILITNKNGDEKYINFKHYGYMKYIIKEMLVDRFEEIKEIHENILAECEQMEV